MGGRATRCKCGTPIQNGGYCKVCRSAYAKARIAERQELFKQLKDVPCADCGERYPHFVMDFDHVRGEKYMNVGQMKMAKLERILEEVAKCDVVCANCHRIRTHGEW